MSKPTARQTLAPAYSQPNVITALVVLVFLAMLFIGVINYPQYGLSTDEEACHYRALVNVNYLSTLAGHDIIDEPVPDFADYPDKDHGVIFDLVAFGFERILNLEDSRDVFIFKHLLNYLVFWLSLIALYFMVKRRFHSPWYGLVAVLFLFLSPRFFADAFYNAKDLIFMAFFLMAMNSATAYLSKPTWPRALLMAGFTALAIATRVMGIVLLPSVFLIVLLKAFREKAKRRSLLGQLGLATLATALLTVLFWPMLWSDPIRNFTAAFSSLSQFIRWEKNVLLMGKFYLSTDLPWFFVPVWIGVTTPLLYLALFFTGLLSQIKQLLFDLKLKIWQTDESLQDTFFLILFFGPIFSVIVLNSVLYDGWRQLYFIYPAFLMIALSGLHAVFQYTRQTQLKKKPRSAKSLRAALIAIILLSLTSTAVWMYRANPLQNVYFNALAGHNWRANYDLDYWGLANREALTAIVTADPSPIIQIASISASSVEESFRILEAKDRNRVQLIAYEKIGSAPRAPGSPPIYVFNNYKRVETPDILDQDPKFEIFYRRLVDQEIILTVYKLK